MKRVTVEEMQKNLEEYLDFVNKTNEVILIETNSKNAVLLSMESYEYLIKCKEKFNQK